MTLYITTSQGRVAMSPEEETAHIAEAEAAAEKKDRLAKVAEITAHAMGLIQARLPAVDTLEEVRLIAAIWPGLAAGADADMLAAKDVYVYSKTKIEQAKTAPIDLIRAYDPTTDPDFPS